MNKNSFETSVNALTSIARRKKIHIFLKYITITSTIVDNSVNCNNLTIIKNNNIHNNDNSSYNINKNNNNNNKNNKNNNNNNNNDNHDNNNNDTNDNHDGDYKKAKNILPLFRLFYDSNKKIKMIFNR